MLKHRDGGPVDGQEITATKVLTPWPQPPTLPASPSPQAIQPCWERAAMASLVAQVPWGLEIPLPSPQSPALEPLQLQLLPSMSRAPQGLPCDLYPIQLTSVTFQAGRVPAAGGVGLGVLLTKVPSSFLLESFYISSS